MQKEGLAVPKGTLGVWEDVLAGYTEGLGGEECTYNVSYR